MMERSMFECMAVKMDNEYLDILRERICRMLKD